MEIGVTDLCACERLAGQIVAALTRRWQRSPVRPLPQFHIGAVPYVLGASRFGAREEKGSDITIAKDTLLNLVPGIIAREVVCTFFPAHVLVPALVDGINHYVPFLLVDNELSASAPKFDSRAWRAAVGHQRHEGSGGRGYQGVDWAHIPGEVEVWDEFLRGICERLCRFAAVITPERASAVVASLYQNPLHWLRRSKVKYMPDDLEYVQAMCAIMAEYQVFPTARRIAKRLPAQDARWCEEKARRIDSLPLSPTYMLNPVALSGELVFVMLEVSPSVSPEMVGEIAFLPLCSLGLNELVGCPQPTYLGTYCFAPCQLDQFFAHLGILRKKGLVLAFHAFRPRVVDDTVNLGLSLNVPAPSLPIARFTSSLEPPVPPLPPSADWRKSWLLRRLIFSLHVRSVVPFSVANVDPKRNVTAVQLLLQAGAALAKADVKAVLAPVASLLEQYRNVNYVVHLCEQVFAAVERAQTAAQQGRPPSPVLASPWVITLLREHKGNVGAAARALLDAVDVLQALAPFAIPREGSVMDFISQSFKIIQEDICQSIQQFPADNQEKVISRMLDTLIHARTFYPKLTLSVMAPGDEEDYAFIARPTIPFATIADRFAEQCAPHLVFGSLTLSQDASGGEVVVAYVKASAEGFRRACRALTGDEGILGKGSSFLAARRVSHWNPSRANFAEAWNSAAKEYAPLDDYLRLVREGVLSHWVPPRHAPMPFAAKVLAHPFRGRIEPGRVAPASRVTLTPDLATALHNSYTAGTAALHNLTMRRLRGVATADLNWPAYGLERFLLQVHLATAKPRYIFSHLITPATRRVLVSTAVGGFQTVLVEYLWPAGSPDVKFLEYLHSRSERNVLAYGVHRVLSDTAFCNLDLTTGPEKDEPPDAIDLRLLVEARPEGPSRARAKEFAYGGEVRHEPGSPGWSAAVDFFAGRTADLPPDAIPAFRFDPTTIGLEEFTAVFARGDFDAAPLCRALPLGHYFRTEETYTGTAETIAGKQGHVILFAFPATRAAHLNAVLDELLRPPAVSFSQVSSFLLDQSLAKVQGVPLARVNPLQANPFDPAAGRYVHLPKRQVRDGVGVTLSLADQYAHLHESWAKFGTKMR